VNRHRARKRVCPPKGIARRDSSSVREPPGQQKRKADHHRRGPQRETSSIRGRRGGRQGPADHQSSRSTQPSGRERSGLNPDVRDCQREELDRHYTFQGREGGKMGSQRGRNAQRSQEHLFQRGHRRDGKRSTKRKEEDHEGAPGRLAAVQGRRHQRERGDLRRRHG
jgi:hypothetical protein